MTLILNQFTKDLQIWAEGCSVEELEVVIKYLKTIKDYKELRENDK